MMGIFCVQGFEGKNVADFLILDNYLVLYMTKTPKTFQKFLILGSKVIKRILDGNFMREYLSGQTYYLLTHQATAKTIIPVQSSLQYFQWVCFKEGFLKKTTF